MTISRAGETVRGYVWGCGVGGRDWEGAIVVPECSTTQCLSPLFSFVCILCACDLRYTMELGGGRAGRRAKGEGGKGVAVDFVVYSDRQ